MIKLIFFTLLTIILSTLLLPFLIEGAAYMLIAIEYLLSASAIVLVCLGAAFGSMNDYNFIKLIFYIGIMFMILNFVFKIVTNHYIASREIKKENIKQKKKEKGNFLKNEKQWINENDANEAYNKFLNTPISKDDPNYFEKSNKQYERRNK